MNGFDTKCKFVLYKRAGDLLEEYNIPFQEWYCDEEFEIRIDVKELTITQKETLLDEFNIYHINEYDYIIFYK